MKSKIKLAAVATALIALFIMPQQVKAVCTVNSSQMVATLAEACWECVFPLSIMGVQTIPGPMPDPQGIIGTPICMCPAPPPVFERIGFPIGFFNPDVAIDSVKDPYCFPSLGFALGGNLNGLGGGSKGDMLDRQRTFFQVHLTHQPIMAILGLLVDVACTQTSGLYIEFMSEVLPTWQNDTLSAFLNPEALLFGNPITAAMCAADSISAMVNFSLDPLFWCKGSWGSAYPLTGTTHTKNYIEDAASAAASAIYLLHRTMTMWQGSTPLALCHPYPLPVWLKSTYRMQVLYPIPHPMAMSIGQSGIIWSFAKNLPVAGDNFSFLLFRKRDCCAF